MAKSLQAADDLLRLLDLHDETHETRGQARFAVQGRVGFRDVEFCYPSRPTAPILHGISFEIKAGECVAIVGYVLGKPVHALVLSRI